MGANGAKGDQSVSDALGATKELLAAAEIAIKNSPEAARQIRTLVTNATLAAINRVVEAMQNSNAKFFDGGKYASTLPDSESVKNLMNEWSAYRNKLAGWSESITLIAGKLFALDPENARVDSAQAGAQKTVDFVGEQIRIAEKIYSEKKRAEEAATKPD